MSNLKEQISQLAANAKEHHWINEPVPETGDDACNLVEKNFKAGAAAGIALVLAEMEQVCDTPISVNPEDGLAGEFDNADSLLVHIKRFTKNLEGEK